MTGRQGIQDKQRVDEVNMPSCSESPLHVRALVNAPETFSEAQSPWLGRCWGGQALKS